MIFYHYVVSDGNPTPGSRALSAHPPPQTHCTALGQRLHSRDLGYWVPTCLKVPCCQIPQQGNDKVLIILLRGVWQSKQSLFLRLKRLVLPAQQGHRSMGPQVPLRRVLPKRCGTCILHMGAHTHVASPGPTHVLSHTCVHTCTRTVAHFCTHTAQDRRMLGSKAVSGRRFQAWCTGCLCGTLESKPAAL